MDIIDYRFEVIGNIVRALWCNPVVPSLHAIEFTVHHSLYSQEGRKSDELRDEALAIDVCEMLNKAAEHAREVTEVLY